MTTAIQDLYFPDGMCFGCGPKNADGLRLKSFEDGDGRAVAEFRPWPQHDNGVGFLNGGVIATVLDCHSAAPMLVKASAEGWWSEGAPLPYVTAGIDLKYLRPTPLAETLALVGELRSADENEMTIHVWVEFDGKFRAEADALWKRWRPRRS